MLKNILNKRILIFCFLLSILTGCDLISGSDEGSDSPIGTWKITEIISDGDSISFPLTFEMKDGTLIDFSWFYMITEDKLYMIDKIETALDDDTLAELSLEWNDKYGNYLSKEGIGCSSSVIDEINETEGRIYFDNYNYYLPYNMIDSTPTFGENGNFIKVEKSDIVFDDDVDLYTDYKPGISWNSASLDTAISVNVDSDNCAFIKVDLTSNKTYYISSPDVGSFSGYYSTSSDLSNYDYTNTYSSSSSNITSSFSCAIEQMTPDSSGTYYIKLKSYNFTGSEINVTISESLPLPDSTIISVNTSASTAYNSSFSYYFFSAELEANTKYYLYDYDGGPIKVYDNNGNDINTSSSSVNLSNCINTPKYFTTSTAGIYYIRLNLYNSDDVSDFGSSVDVNLSLSSTVPDESIEYTLGESVEVPSGKRLILKTTLNSNTNYYYYTNKSGGGSSFSGRIYEDSSDLLSSDSLYSVSSQIYIDTYIQYDTDYTSSSVGSFSYIVVSFNSYLSNDTFTISATDPR